MIRHKLIIFFLLISTSIVFAGNYQSAELDELFQKLAKNHDPSYGSSLEKKIWKIWSMHHSDQKLTNKLELGKELMNNGSYNFALEVFTNIIKSDPLWPEAWNARATLLFYMNDYENSLKDIDKVLHLEPRHFGALSGRAQISIRLEQYEKAISDLKKAKKINPTISGGNLIPELKKLIKGLNI
jgi:tetratricopeptide (TPR) repeat protein